MKKIFGEGQTGAYGSCDQKVMLVWARTVKSAYRCDMSGARVKSLREVKEATKTDLEIAVVFNK